MSFRNSDCAAVRVDYVEMSTVQCVANTLFLTLEQVFDRSVQRSNLCSQESFMHEPCVPSWEVAFLSQQERTAAIQYTSENSV